jgi:6-pyruvoyl tetrahydropterin synthase/QueD family protein
MGETVCKECSGKFKQITNTHLLRCCGLTIQEYCYKHGLQFLDMVSPETYKLRIASHTEQSKQNGKETRRKTLIGNKFTPNKEEEQILIGTLLGDGYIHSGKKLKTSSYLEITHGIKQLDYLIWKAIKLKRFGPKIRQSFFYSNERQRFRASTTMYTKNNFLFGELGRSFYSLTSKKIDKDLIEKLEPLGLAVWFMDAGSINKTSCHICSQSFSKEDNDIISDVINKKFLLRTYVRETNGESIIIIPSESRKDFLSIIAPFIIPSMRYKLKEQEAKSAFKMTVCKRTHFDAAHFLEDYKGKCGTMHGGRWTLDVYVSGEINPETGMIVDYTYLKHIIKNYIIDKLDHKCLNYTISEVAYRSTTELLCIWIWFVLVETMFGLKKIRLYETPESWCDYVGPSFEELKHIEGKNHPDLEFLRNFQIPNLYERKARMKGNIYEMFDDILCDGGVPIEFEKRGKIRIEALHEQK